MLPIAPPEGIVELFLLGGLNPWDTFYVVPEFGEPARGGPYAGQQWWTFQSGVDAVPETFAKCGGGERPLLEPWKLDGAGRQVNLGPFLYPLRDRPDLLARMLVFVVSHDQEPHQQAVPLVMGGHPRGSQRLAGMGAHVARYWQENGGGQSSPYAYTLFSNSDFVSALEAEVVASVGLHPGSARPLAVRVIADNPLAAEVKRPTFGAYRSAADAAIAFYAERYGERLRPEHASELLRSRAFQDYLFASQSLEHAPSLDQLFSADALSTFPASDCGVEVDIDATGMGLKLATHLVTSATNRARYALFVDTGIMEAGCGGYDTHQYHVRTASLNVVHTFKQLTQRINAPGEGDPKKLDLDKQLVLITTEMGRTPFPQELSDQDLGLNHWPYGFVCIALGGFVGPEQAGIVGSIGEDGRGVTYLTPSEFRAAMLMASGIWPFAPESFNVGSVRDATTELDAAMRLKAALGYG